MAWNKTCIPVGRLVAYPGHGVRPAGRFKISINPKRGGTRLIFFYTMYTPQIMSDQGGRILMNIAEVPGLMGKMLIDTKLNTEAAG